jgi:ABC-2 type transport system permease protein
MKEAQSLMTPLMLVIVLPMFVMQNVITQPNSTMSLGMSLFPPATPLPDDAASVGASGNSAVAGPYWVSRWCWRLHSCASSLPCRIFRVGILMQGKGAKIGEMVRWAIRG